MTSFSLPSAAASRLPAAALAGSSTVPSGALTSSTRLVWPPYWSLIICCARLDAVFGSLKPPFLSLPNAPAPKTAAAISTTPEMTNSSLARRTTNSP